MMRAVHEDDVHLPKMGREIKPRGVAEKLLDLARGRFAAIIGSGRAGPDERRIIDICPHLEVRPQIWRQIERVDDAMGGRVVGKIQGGSTAISPNLKNLLWRTDASDEREIGKFIHGIVDSGSLH